MSNSKDIPSPDDNAVPEPSRKPHDQTWLLIQSLHEMNSEVSKTSVKLDRLISDAEKIDTRLKEVEGKLLMVSGYSRAAIVLVPLCAALVWWIIGGKIDDLRDQFFQAHVSPPTAVSPSNPTMAKVGR